MAPLGYFSSLGLFTLGTLCATRANSLAFKASCLEEGLSNALPIDEGKTSYVALKAFVLPQNRLPVGQLHVIKSPSVIDYTLEVLGGEIPEFIDLLKQPDDTFTLTNFPKEITLTHLKTKIIAHDLHLAKWIRPIKDEVIIFADAVKKGAEIHLHKPSDNRPFIATTEEPSQLIREMRVKAHQSKRNAKLYTISAVGLGVGTFTWKKRNNVQWIRIATNGTLKKTAACVSLAAVLWTAYENQSWIQRVHKND